MKSFLLFLSAFTLILPATQANQLVNRVAAKVNGEIITLNELMIKVAPQQSVLMSQHPRRGPSYERKLKKLKDQVLDELIDRTIIYSQYKQNLHNLPDHAVEEEVQKFIRNIYAGDQKLFRDYLKATNLTRAQFKEQQRKELLVSIIRSQHFGEVLPPTEKEMRIEYASWAKANRDRQKDTGIFRQIFIPANSNKEERAAQLKLAEDIVKKVKAGADFAELAKKESKDSRAAFGGLSKDNVEDKIPTPRTDLPYELGFAVFESTTKEVMGPMESQIGFFIFQVVERNLGPSKPLHEVRDLIKRRVVGQKKRLNLEKWMKKLRARVPIEKMI